MESVLKLFVILVFGVFSTSGVFAAGKLRTPFLNACPLSADSAVASTQVSVEPPAIEVLESLVDQLEISVVQMPSLFESNSENFNHMIQVVQKIGFEDSKRLVEIEQQVIDMLTESVHVVPKDVEGRTYSAVKFHRIAKPFLVTRFLSLVEESLGPNRNSSLTEKMALQRLYVARAYETRRWTPRFSTFASLVRDFFENFSPTRSRSTFEMISMFQFLSQMNIKVPVSWSEMSLDWLWNHRKKMSLLDTAQVYRQMVDSGVGLDDHIEDFLYTSMVQQRKRLKRSQIVYILEKVAGALVVASVNVPKQDLFSHYQRLHETLSELRLNYKYSFFIQLFYLNAVYNLKMLPKESVEFTDQLLELRGASHTSHIEEQTGQILKELYGADQVRERDPVHPPLPPADWSVFGQQLIVEVDGPLHDTHLIEIDEDGKVEVFWGPLREFDRVVGRIYKGLGFRHVRVHHVEFSNSHEQIKAHLKSLIDKATQSENN